MKTAVCESRLPGHCSRFALPKAAQHSSWRPMTCRGFAHDGLAELFDLGKGWTMTDQTPRRARKRRITRERVDKIIDRVAAFLIRLFS
jgi:hypothetical protein